MTEKERIELEAKITKQAINECSEKSVEMLVWIKGYNAGLSAVMKLIEDAKNEKTNSSLQS